MQYPAITSCRVCGSKTLKPILSLGNLHLNAFVKSPQETTEVAPLDLVFCPQCTLVELRHNADFNALFVERYWYRSGLNPAIVADLKEIVGEAVGLGVLKPGDTFLDIGANDGTLLGFVPREYFRIGVEPAKNLAAALQKNANVVLNNRWEEVASLPEGRRAKVITAIAMLYDLRDPHEFMRLIRLHLASDGVFVAQLMPLAPMVRKNDIGNICHEHLEYYTYPSLKYLFEKNGLEIFRIEENDMNGGSYRVFSRHLGSGSIDYPEHISEGDLHEFAKRIRQNKENTVRFIRDEVAKGKKVYGYGASTKGNTILQWYGLDTSLLAGIADKNPEKWGRYTVGTNIPIVSEEEARGSADYFFVLPWGFLDVFLERERKWHDAGGKFIVSAPEFKVI